MASVNGLLLYRSVDDVDLNSLTLRSIPVTRWRLRGVAYSGAHDEPGCRIARRITACKSPAKKAHTTFSSFHANPDLSVRFQD